MNRLRVVATIVLASLCGSLTAVQAQDFFLETFNGEPGPGLPADWVSIGNGEWAIAEGCAVQSHGPVDDNLSALKLVDQHFGDFELELAFRQDDGIIISSGLNLFFRMGDDPGPGPNVPGLGPAYVVGWGRTRPGYPHPDIFLNVNDGWTQASPGVYRPVNSRTIASATLNWDGNWFELDEWHTIRVQATGDHIRVWADGVLAIDATDATLTGGRIALNDHFANTSWDHVRVDARCRIEGDINSDGDVDLTDLGILLANFGLSCLP